MASVERPAAPDCENCWQRAECSRAEDGQFCGMWQFEPPPAREPDPNEQWLRGEEAVF